MTDPDHTSDVAALVSAFLDEEMEEHPVRASAFGVDGHDDRLGEFSEADVRRREANEDRWHARFAAVADEGLSLDDRIDRDLVVSTLAGRRAMRRWEGWRRDPGMYLDPGLSGVFVLFLHRLRPEAELVESAAARFRAVPDVLDAARANLDPELVSPVMVERALGACRAGIAYARDLAPAEVGDDAGRADLAEAGEVAAGALEGFLLFLEELAETADGSYAIGEDLYSELLLERELLAYGAADMRERGRAAYAELDDQMQELAARVDGHAGADWRSVLDRLNADHPETPEAMRREYEEWTARARRFLVANPLVTLPEGERCLVVPSPHFQRPTLAVASYARPPAFKPSLTGHFFVPFPPDGTPEAEVQKRLETNGRHSIPTISVHEAYPGHHWHLVALQESARPVRKVLTTSYFVEGWALYAEKVMREHGFFTDPRWELCHLDARIFRAARIVVDTSLHIGDMTFDEAVEFMRTKASLSEPTARAEVARYCAWPTQASSYLTGALEIERIRRRYIGEGRGTLLQFNDTIARSGGLPIALAEQAVLGG